MNDLNLSTADISYCTDALAQRQAELLMLNSCYVDVKSDQMLANLQLELKGLEIGLPAT